MPTIDYQNIGDVLDYEYLQGVIMTIDSATDTCTVYVCGAIVDALLFYHCKPDSALRSNGAITGAAAGFAVNDQVIVLKKKDNSRTLVIGHTDGVKRCVPTYIIVYMPDFFEYSLYLIGESDIELLKTLSATQFDAFIRPNGHSYEGDDDCLKITDAALVSRGIIYWNYDKPQNSVVAVVGSSFGLPGNFVSPIDGNIVLQDDGINPPVQISQLNQNSTLFGAMGAINCYANIPNCQHSETLGNDDIQLLLLRHKHRIIKLSNSSFGKKVFTGYSPGTYVSFVSTSANQSVAEEAWTKRRVAGESDGNYMVIDSELHYSTLWPDGTTTYTVNASFTQYNAIYEYEAHISYRLSLMGLDGSVIATMKSRSRIIKGESEGSGVVGLGTFMVEARSRDNWDALVLI